MQSAMQWDGFRCAGRCYGAMGDEAKRCAMHLMTRWRDELCNGIVGFDGRCERTMRDAKADVVERWAMRWSEAVRCAMLFIIRYVMLSYEMCTIRDAVRDAIRWH